MDAATLSRWQFGITTVYHFFFVPITIGLTWLICILQTKWVRTGDENWLRLTKFFGKLFLINFAAGVVTGIVQEFQFGMNWSEYSRFVGDIFGVPLALEALIAFFAESTFIGLWIFGWDRLSKKLHLATAYLVALSSTLSALFILAANAWMQNPVGAIYRNGRAELDSLGSIFLNPFFLSAFPHQIAASLMVAGGLMAGIGGWWLAKNRKARVESETGIETPAQRDEKRAWKSSIRLGAWALIIGALGVSITGHAQAQEETRRQPAKLAASEGLFDSTTQAPFSVVAIFTADGTQEVWSFQVPYLLSILAYNDPNAKVLGMNDIRADFRRQGFTADDGTRNALQEAYQVHVDNANLNPIPNVWVSYYSFRLMIGLGMLGAGIGALLLFSIRGDNVPAPTKAWDICFKALPFLPLFGNSFGWSLTEMGRQPWIVYGVLPTYSANSPSVSSGQVLFTMVGFTLIYGVIAVVVLKLFTTYIAKGLPAVTAPDQLEANEPLHFAY